MIERLACSDHIPTEQAEPSPPPAAAWVLLSVFLLYYLQKNYSDNVIREISDEIVQSAHRGKRRNTPFSKRIMIFSLTLAGYSSRAYRYVRSVANNSLPSRQTLQKYRNRVDGSPGFSSTALKMITSKAEEMSIESKKLFLSLSCDDMSIRYKCKFLICIAVWPEVRTKSEDLSLQFFDDPHTRTIPIK